MLASVHLSPGTVILVGGALMRVESAIKVSTGAASYMKVILLTIPGEELVERKFKLDQEFEEVSLKERVLEFLYPEKGKFLFLDVDTLDHVQVDGEVVADRSHYLKEGVQVKANSWGSSIFSIELPQFLELMVGKVQEPTAKQRQKNPSLERMAILETGAAIEVPSFIEAGDVVKVDSRSSEFVQRV